MGRLLRNVFIGSVVGATVVLAILSQSDEDSESEKEVTKTIKNNPSDLTFTDWKRALKETWKALQNKNLTVWSAALAYYATFALFPTLTAFVAIFTLVISSQQLQAITEAVQQYLPSDIADIITSQLMSLSQNPTANIVAAVISVALALFAASAATQNLIKGTNLAYNVREGRDFIKQRSLAIVMLLIGIVVVIPVVVLLLAASGGLLSFIGAPQWLSSLLPIARWVLLAIFISLVLAAIYRYAPHRHKPKWQWVSWGAAIATAVWLIGSAAFFYYLANLANYSETYGIFAGLIALMLWFNLSAFIILLGAQVNHNLEQQADSAAVTF